MRWTKLCAFFFYINVLTVRSAKLDIVKCGVDDSETEEGFVPNDKYPWLGVLFYTLYGEAGETRSVTTVVLIQEEFAIGNSADIAPMPKLTFRDQARVLFGEGWERHGRRVRNYVVHPEYGETINSVALIHLRQPYRERPMKPICPPPERIRFPKYWVIKFEEKLEPLQKTVLPMVSVPADFCRAFYINANLYEEKRRPSHALCAASAETKTPCVWGAGAALCTRDVWGRWQLLGLGAYGAGCGAPSRYLNMRYYYPWIEEMLNKFQRITISRINDHRYVLRSGSRVGNLMSFGDCDVLETRNLIYRDSFNLYTDNNNVKIFRHNITIYDSVDYTCVTFQLVRASATARMRVQHFCPRSPGGAACYSYRGTRFDIAVEVIFTETCVLDIHAYGLHVNMSMLDIQEWKWEEGTFYEDFRDVRYLNVIITSKSMILFRNNNIVTDKKFVLTKQSIFYGGHNIRFLNASWRVYDIWVDKNAYVTGLQGLGFTIATDSKYVERSISVVERNSTLTTLTHVEYRGPTYATQFGFEPVDQAMWVPNYDIWTTTESNLSLTVTTSRYTQTANDVKELKSYAYEPTTAVPTTTSKTKKPFKKKTPPPPKYFYKITLQNFFTPETGYVIWDWIKNLFGR